MPRTLYGKLVVAMLALIGLVSVVYVLLTFYTTRLYLEEVNQKLNRDLAEGIVGETTLLRDGVADEAALEALFHTLMVINPSIEVYLTDANGTILAYTAPPGKVQRERIALAPVQAFLEGREAFPIRGDDPRDHGRRKVFSAAPVLDGDRLVGFLYVVLGGEAFDSVVEIIGESYVLRLALGVGAVSLALSLAAGLGAFNWLTRRLKRLTRAVEAFRRSDFQAEMSPAGWRRGKGDEIDELGAVVEEMSQRIAEQLRRLRHLDAARRELVANVSHDLRTPLSSLQGYLETLRLKDPGASAEERRRYLDLALDHSHRLARLIAELFELSLLESHEPGLNLEPFSLAELVQDIAQKFRVQAQAKALRLETEIPEQAPFVTGDIALIERVLENLIENAIRYTPDGGAVRLAVVPGDDRLTVTVADTGSGIPEADLPHIFERFYRVEKSRSQGPEGTGLGLAIAQRILQLHGSLIDVESRPGRGSSFTFRLPVSDKTGLSAA